MTAESNGIKKLSSSCLQSTLEENLEWIVVLFAFISFFLSTLIVFYNEGEKNFHWITIRNEPAGGFNPKEKCHVSNFFCSFSGKKGIPITFQEEILVLTKERKCVVHANLGQSNVNLTTIINHMTIALQNFSSQSRL